LLVALVLSIFIPLSEGNVMVVQSRNIIYAPATITPYQWIFINQTITYKDVTKLQHLDLELIASGYAYPTDYVNASEFYNSSYVDSEGVFVYDDTVPRWGNDSYAVTVVSGTDANVDALDGLSLVFDINSSDTNFVPHYAIRFASCAHRLVCAVNISVTVNVSGVVDVVRTLDDLGGEYGQGSNDDVLFSDITSGNYTMFCGIGQMYYPEPTDIVFATRPGEYSGIIRVEVDLAVLEEGVFQHNVSTSLFLQPVGKTWKDTYYPENGSSVHITLNTSANVEKIYCEFNGENFTDSINSGEIEGDLGTLHMDSIDGGLQNITLSINASEQYLRFNLDGKNRWVDTGIGTVHYVFIYDNNNGLFSRYIPMVGNYSPYLNPSLCSIDINNDSHTITVRWVIRLSPMAAAGEWAVRSTAYFSDGSLFNSTTTSVNYWISYIVSPDVFWWMTTSPNTTGIPIVSPADGYLKINWSANTPANLLINRTEFNYTGDPFVVHLDNASGLEIPTTSPILARSLDRVHREYFVISNVTFYLDVGNVPDGFYRTTINFWMEVT